MFDVKPQKKSKRSFVLTVEKKEFLKSELVKAQWHEGKQTIYIKQMIIKSAAAEPPFNFSYNLLTVFFSTTGGNSDKVYNKLTFR